MTKIEWTDKTWNPLVGCSRISDGCDNCYAIGVVHRQMSPQHVGLTVKSAGERTDWTGEVRVVESRMDEPLRRRKPTRWFVNSLSDLFHPDVSDETIARVFAVMALAPQHTFQVLTKRPQRMAELLTLPGFPICVRDEMDELCDEHGLPYLPLDESITWPLPNVWLGTSIESDRYAFRADYLRRTPAAVRFVSAEPLLGPLSSLDLTGIDWLIVGGESGPGARPMHPDWVRDLRDECEPSYRITGHDHAGQTTEPTHRPAFFFKQWGDWVERPCGTERGDSVANDPTLLVNDPDLKVVWMEPVGKKAAGRLLDGRTWDEMPSAAAVSALTSELETP